MIGLNFTQASPDTTWTITHNFGFKPACDVYIDDAGPVQKAMPLDIVHVSDDELQIVWSEAHSGGARLIGDESYIFPSTSTIDPGSP